ncbi:MAG: DUF5681 domain-containing protein [Acetobacteraceae bacterium]
MSQPMSDKRSSEVGYGRPPRHTSFKKGRSGNPAGRPKGAKNLATLIAEALNRRVAVTDNGQRRIVTRREAIIAELVNKSAAADLKAIAMLLSLVRQLETGGGPGGPRGPTASPANASRTTPTAAADRAVIAGLIARLHGAGENP